MELGSAATGLAAVNATIAVLLAVAGATGAARLRKTQEWIERSLKMDSEGHRADALGDEARRISARLLAREHVPPRCFVEIAAFTVAAPVVLTIEGSPITVLLVAIVLWMTSRRAGWLLRERIRVIGEFYSGQDVTRARVSILHQMEGGTTREFLWALVYTAGVIVLGLTIGRGVSADRVDTVTLALGLLGFGLLHVVYLYYQRLYVAAFNGAKD